MVKDDKVGTEVEKYHINIYNCLDVYMHRCLVKRTLSVLNEAIISGLSYPHSP